MDTNSLAQSPFSVLTFIVAPALLTNATSVLVMSTINRMLRTRERTHELFDKSQGEATNDGPYFLTQVNRVERQAVLLLASLRSLYVALGSFAAATLITLLGAVLAHWNVPQIQKSVGGISLLLGLILSFVFCLN